MKKALIVLVPLLAISVVAMAWTTRTTVPTITTSSITRNVYDDDTKVGELSFVVKKFTPMSGEGWIKVDPGDMEFFVTNQNYMTVQSPMPMQEEIDMVEGAETEQDSWGETCPIQLYGEVGADTDPAFSFWVQLINDFDWEDFYDDPDEQADAITHVEYRNLGASATYMPDGWLWLEVKEETE